MIDVCATCLASDRSLIILKDSGNFDMFFKFIVKKLMAQKGYKKIQLTNKICWECSAQLTNIRRFQNKAFYSLERLQEYYGDNYRYFYRNTLCPLTTLCARKLESYDTPESSIGNCKGSTENDSTGNCEGSTENGSTGNSECSTENGGTGNCEGSTENGSTENGSTENGSVKKIEHDHAYTNKIAIKLEEWEDTTFIENAFDYSEVLPEPSTDMDSDLELSIKQEMEVEIDMTVDMTEDDPLCDIDSEATLSADECVDEIVDHDNDTKRAQNTKSIKRVCFKGTPKRNIRLKNIDNLKDLSQVIDTSRVNLDLSRVNFDTNSGGLTPLLPIIREVEPSWRLRTLSQKELLSLRRRELKKQSYTKKDYKCEGCIVSNFSDLDLEKHNKLRHHKYFYRNTLCPLTTLCARKLKSYDTSESSIGNCEGSTENVSTGNCEGSTENGSAGNCEGSTEIGSTGNCEGSTENGSTGNYEGSTENCSTGNCEGSTENGSTGNCEGSTENGSTENGSVRKIEHDHAYTNKIAIKLEEWEDTTFIENAFDYSEVLPEPPTDMDSDLELSIKQEMEVEIDMTVDMTEDDPLCDIDSEATLSAVECVDEIVDHDNDTKRAQNTKSIKRVCFKGTPKRNIRLKNIDNLKDSSQVKFDSSQVNLDSSRVKFDSSQVKLDSSRVNLDSSRVNLDSSRVNLDSSRVNFDTSSGGLTPLLPIIGEVEPSWRLRTLSQKELLSLRRRELKKQSYTKKDYKCEGCIVSYFSDLDLENHNKLRHHKYFYRNTLCPPTTLCARKLESYDTPESSIGNCEGSTENVSTGNCEGSTENGSTGNCEGSTENGSSGNCEGSTENCSTGNCEGSTENSSTGNCEGSTENCSTGNCEGSTENGSTGNCEGSTENGSVRNIEHDHAYTNKIAIKLEEWEDTTFIENAFDYSEVLPEPPTDMDSDLKLSIKQEMEVEIDMTVDMTEDDPLCDIDSEATLSAVECVDEIVDLDNDTKRVQNTKSIKRVCFKGTPKRNIRLKNIDNLKDSSQVKFDKSRVKFDLSQVNLDSSQVNLDSSQVNFDTNSGGLTPLLPIIREVEPSWRLRTLSQKELLSLRGRELKKQSYTKKDYKCEGCIVSYFSDLDLENHNKLRHHKEFGTLPGLKVHQRKEHDPNYVRQLKYMCDACGASFAHLPASKMHAVIHSGLKPYECSTCTFKTAHKSSLFTHIKLVHEKVKRKRKAKH